MEPVPHLPARPQAGCGNAWGNVLENCSYTSNKSKYKFTGKERDDESSYDCFGVRYYDSRIGRWGGVEVKYSGYEQFSPYQYAGNNPVILSDINGRENIVVVGGEDITQDDRNKFINAGIMAAQEIAGSDELTTIVVMTSYTNWFAEQIISSFTNDNINVVFAGSTEELFNYINSGSIDNSELTDGRINDKVTDMLIFAHGRVGSIEFAYDGQEGMTEIEKMFFVGTKDLENIKDGAFSQYSTIRLFSCNAATGQNNIAQMLSKQTKGTVSGYAGLVSYQYIYEGATITNRILRKLYSGIGPAINYPVADKENVEYKVYVNGN